MSWKSHLKISLMMLFLTLFQTSFLVPLFNVQAPVIIFTYSLALLASNENQKAYYSGFLGGLLLDFLGSGLLGKHSLFFIVFLLLVFYIRKHIFDNAFLHFIAVVLFSFAWGFLKEGNLFFNGLFIVLNLLSFAVFYLYFRQFKSKDTLEGSY